MRYLKSLLGLLMALAFGSSTIAAEGNDSRYFSKSTNSENVIVFVHGLFGTAKETWADWPRMIKEDQEYSNSDIFLYEYPSSMYSSAFSINELTENMRLILEANDVFKHKSIIFVAHSMGGIVTRSFLSRYRNYAPAVAFVYFYATPTTGSDIASVFAWMSKNPQLGQLRPMTNTSDLARIQSDWLAAGFSFPTYCAYETLPTYGAIVVNISSATNLCTKRLDPMNANHIDIVKPKSSSDLAYIALRQAYREMQPPRLPAETGWIFVGYATQGAWVEGPYVTIEDMRQRFDRRPVEIGDTISLKVPRRVVIVNYRYSQANEMMRSPIENELFEDREAHLGDQHYTGVQLRAGTRLLVRDVAIGRRSGSTASAIWARVAHPPQ